MGEHEKRLERAVKAIALMVPFQSGYWTPQQERDLSRMIAQEVITSYLGEDYLAVPKMPTEAMIEIGRIYYDPVDSWPAMLNAACLGDWIKQPLKNESTFSPSKT